MSDPNDIEEQFRTLYATIAELQAENAALRADLQPKIPASVTDPNDPAYKMTRDEAPLTIEDIELIILLRLQSYVAPLEIVIDGYGSAPRAGLSFSIPDLVAS